MRDKIHTIDLFEFAKTIKINFFFTIHPTDGIDSNDIFSQFT